MSSDYLIEKALADYWGNPMQDNPVILEAQRVSRPSGALNSMTLMGRNLQLPIVGAYFQVYQVGQTYEQLVNIDAFRLEWEMEKWVKFSDMVNDTFVLAELYNTYGVSLPLHRSYYMYTKERALIFAVERNSRFDVHLDDQPIYLRTYLNAYFASDRSGGNDYLRVEGTTTKTTQEILDFQARVAYYQGLDGFTRVYVNGNRLNGFDVATVSVYDVVELVYDSTVKRVVRFAIGDLPSFTSRLDAKFKYLLHYDAVVDVIDFQDDLEIDIMLPTTAGHEVGRYYHRNKIDSHRNLTHKDYSVVVEYIVSIAQNLLTQLGSMAQVNDMVLEMKVRASGYERPLQYISSYIHDLYKLSSDQIVEAMVGVNSGVVFWQAATLEESPYMTLMRSFREDVTLELAQNAYGYAGASVVLGKSPVALTLEQGTTRTTQVPVGYRNQSTAYLYDTDGVLLAYDTGVGTSTSYTATDANARSIEFIYGKGTDTPDVRFGDTSVQTNVNANYRVYMCYKIAGVPNNEWHDITGDSRYSVNSTGLLTWTAGEVGQYLMVRHDDTFVTQDLALTSIVNTFYFTLAEQVNRGSGLGLYPCQVPSAKIDVFLNGRRLVRDLEYTVVFPKIYVISQIHLRQPAATAVQNIHVRMYGLCDGQTMDFDPIDDAGFVEHGLLSNNGVFNLRDGRVMSYTVGGFLRLPDQVQFSEMDDTTISIVNPLNGLPYQVQELPVTPKNFTVDNMWSMRAEAKTRQTQISGYLTPRIPQPDRGMFSIATRLAIVSPFIAHILGDLTAGNVPIGDIPTTMTDNQIITYCESRWTDLLQFDPINSELGFDYRFVQVRPHGQSVVVSINPIQYSFLSRVVGLYARGIVELSPFVNIDYFQA